MEVSSRGGPVAAERAFSASLGLHAFPLLAGLDK